MTNPTYVRACMTTFCPNFLCTNLSLRKVKERDVQVKIFHDRQKPFWEFQQPADVETFVKFPYRSFMKS